MQVRTHDAVVMAPAKEREFLQKVLSDDATPITLGREIPTENDAYAVVGYGGAKGGGKTHTSSLAATLLSLQYSNIKGVLFRRGQMSATANYRVEVQKVLYEMGLAEAAQFKVSGNLFRFWNGSELWLAFINQERDYDRYQGLEFAFMGFGEATQHAETKFDLLKSCNRSTNPRCRARAWLDCNPGGVGHQWVRERFIDKRTRRPDYYWIPAGVYDNPALIINTPNYIRDSLDSLPLWMRKQYKDGDWNTVAGQFWDLDPELVMEVEPPYYADWFGGVDWGYTNPFACIYVARWQEPYMRLDQSGYEMRDRCHVYSEVYQPRLHLDEQAEAVKRMEENLPLHGSRVLYYADPATGKGLETVSTEAGRTYHSVWAQHGFYTAAAKTNARVPGWNLVKQLLRRGVMTISPKCNALLGEMASHQYEGAPGPATSEDMQQGSTVMDHATDALRYCIVSVFPMGYTGPIRDPRTGAFNA